MLRCPKCNRTYQDDMQKFCTHDGGRLAPDIDKPKPFDPNATVTGDVTAFDIPGDPASGPPTVQDLGATIAAPTPSAPPSSAPPSPLPSAPSTTGFRSSETAPTTFPETTSFGQKHPDAPAQYPSVSTPPPPPSPPVVVPAQPDSRPGLSTDIPGVSTPLPPQAAPPSSQPAPAPSQTTPVPAPSKESRLRLTMVIVGVLLLILVVGGGVAAYFLFVKERTPRRGREVTVTPTLKSNDNVGATKPEPPADIKPKTSEAPPNSAKFENSLSSLDGKLAEHYVDFYFYYPQEWQKNPKAGVRGAANFVEVERKLPPDFTQENVTVSWYESKGTVEADLAGKLPALIKARNTNLASTLPEYQKVSEGKTTVNGIEGYEFRFKAVSRGTDKGDIYIWGRVVFLPPGDETSTKGVTLYMFTTSLATELKSVDDVGVKGELPIILNSFTLGKS